MLRQLPPSHDNDQSMAMYSSGMKYAPSVVIVSLQRSEHGNVFFRYETCSVSCHRLMTTVTVIYLQFWAYESWDSLFPISMNPTANL